MKLYKLHTTIEAGTSCGYQFFARKDDAYRAAGLHRKEHPEERAEVESIEVEPTKGGILQALNRFASLEYQP